MNNVSFQGERGAYSEAASLSFFGNEIEAIPCFTFADVLKNTENDVSDYSICLLKTHLKEVSVKAMTCCYQRILMS